MKNKTSRSCFPPCAQVSHFVLRLAHCRGEELRRWFLAQEGELFAARFREEPGKVKLTMNNIEIIIIT